MDPATTEQIFPRSNSSALATAQPPASKGPPQSLIADAVRNPAWLWLTSVVPLALLFLSAQYTYSLIAGDLSPAERWECLAQGAGLVALIAVTATLAWDGMRPGRLLSPVQAGGALLVAIAAMVLGITFTSYTIPWSMPEWIVGRDELLYRCFCLAMPGAFHALLLLSSGPGRRGTGIEFLKALGVVAGCVGGAFVFSYSMALIGQFFRGVEMPEWAGIALIGIIAFGSGTILSAAVIRLTLLAYLAVRRRPVHQLPQARAFSGL